MNANHGSRVDRGSHEAEGPGARPHPPLPKDAAAIIAVRNLALFPGMVTAVSIGREQSVTAAQEAIKTERPLGILLQRDPAEDEPGPRELYGVGTMAHVLRYITTPDGSHHLICHGEHRFRVIEFLDGWPFLVARIVQVPEDETLSSALEARLVTLRQQVQEYAEALPMPPMELINAIHQLTAPGPAADLVTGLMDIKAQEKQEILETFDVRERLDKVLARMAHVLEVIHMSRKITEQTREAMDARQREFLLREQLKQIQKELGDTDETAAELEEVAKAIANAKMPEEVEKQARKELKRLQRMPDSAGEYSMIRTYLDWLTELPWSKESETAIDIAEARRILDEDHYGLEKIKKRMLEYLAIRKLNPGGKSPILCFVGPPGVGKTSLGQSIAHATGRKFVHASLGGVHDEAEIRGHRRTYIGALPGSIIQGIHNAGTRNPVFMLDEMDKLGAGGFHGDPASALLEALDPEQNGTFRDNYLGLPFDLSHVMFIGTANVLDTIPGPLRDRMEVIQLPGYTEEEKLEIARRYLVARQLATNGLTAPQCAFEEGALAAIVRDYTREAGVRNLEREIGSVLRHVAMGVAEGKVESVRVKPEDLGEILGPPRFESETAMRTSVPGVATGLAWTPVGGDILFIEAARVPGSGKLLLTGQLGDVMKESAQAALSLLKGRLGELGVSGEDFEQLDVHIHVPAGATPKDGPSAGIAMFVALASLFTGRSVRSDTAMTGEISLRGLVLPVGGIKEKVLAALRSGISRVLLPERNRKEYEDVPPAARERLQILWIDQVHEALEAVLEEGRDI
ncbi:Lon protease [Geothrix limicola]|uniref:Lon protease n=1 Tax=Geothrix limicola TaxID=2927978 RepID=A0ABQ5QEV1_9BACT|nr:endopeptidase La [Geothrix limicola]GLH72866.1 Lon protease [Geothrix limicola]